MRTFQEFFRRFGRRRAVAEALLFESKNISTHRGPNVYKDSKAYLHRLHAPNFRQMQRSAHQGAKYRLQGKLDDFEAVALETVLGILRGNVGASGVKALKASLRSLYHDAYALGTGGSAAGLHPEADLRSVEDRRWIDSAATHEMRYFNNFLAQVADRQLSPAQISQRLGMYVDTVRGVYDAGRVTGAHPHSLIYWIYQPEAQHCPSCLYLRDHSPYTKETLPTTPRAGATRCLSNCKCHLRFVNADLEVVRQVEATSSRSGHLASLNALKGQRGIRRNPASRRPVI